MPGGELCGDRNASPGAQPALGIVIRGASAQFECAEWPSADHIQTGKPQIVPRRTGNGGQRLHGPGYRLDTWLPRNFRPGCLVEISANLEVGATSHEIDTRSESAGGAVVRNADREINRNPESDAEDVANCEQPIANRSASG